MGNAAWHGAIFLATIARASVRDTARWNSTARLGAVQQTRIQTLASSCWRCWISGRQFFIHRLYRQPWILQNHVRCRGCSCWSWYITPTCPQNPISNSPSQGSDWGTVPKLRVRSPDHTGAMSGVRNNPASSGSISKTTINLTHRPHRRNSITWNSPKSFMTQSRSTMFC
jgi:hypothetical protein